jgi:hypothetical protein
MIRAIGPFAGLFGGGQGERTQALDVRGSMFGSYDVDRVKGVDPSTLGDLGLAQSGAASGIDGTVSYSRKAERVQFALSGGGSFQDFAASGFSGATYDGGTSLGVNLTRKVVLSAAGGISHAPYYGFAPGLAPDPLSGIPLAPGYRYAAVADPTTSLAGSLSLANNFSRRSTLGADVHWTQTRFRGVDANGDRSTQYFSDVGASVSFSRHISRLLAFHATYGRDQVRNVTSGSPFFQTIEVGLDYGSTLSFARRTRLSFSTSTSVLRFEGASHVRVDGSVSLMRGFARTWSASVGYVRGTEFVPGFGQPLLSDAVDVSIGGSIAPRAQWSANAGYSSGQIGYTGSGSFGTWLASSTLEYALTRRLAVFGQYSFYRYRIPAGSTVIPLLPTFRRDAGTVGLTVWLPIIKSRGSE